MPLDVVGYELPPTNLKRTIAWWVGIILFLAVGMGLVLWVGAEVHRRDGLAARAAYAAMLSGGDLSRFMTPACIANAADLEKRFGKIESFSNETVTGDPLPSETHVSFEVQRRGRTYREFFLVLKGKGILMTEENYGR